MTETPATEPEEVGEEVGPMTVNCRHCGQPNEVDVEATPDWQCPACERYQDAMQCPTCGQTARISLLPKDIVPEPHAPARRRRT